MIAALLVACGAFAAPEVVELPLGESLSRRGLQVSGMAWYQELQKEASKLFFITQSSASSWIIYAADRAQINSAIEESVPIEATLVPVENEVIADDFDGLEGAAIVGDTIYLLIEGNGKQAYVASGHIAPTDGIKIVMEHHQAYVLEVNNSQPNITYEAITWLRKEFIVFEEASCASRMQPALAWTSFQHKTIPFDPIGDRITDATSLDANQRFWISTFEYENELQCEPRDERSPERLVELASDNGIVRTGRSIDLNEGRPVDAPARNWEGIARWDDTHLLVINDDLPSRARTTLLLVTIPD